MNYDQSPFGFPNNGYGAYGWKERLKSFFRQRSAIRDLLIINIGMAVLLLAIFIVAKPIAFLAGGHFSVKEYLFPWLACPADMTTLLHRPWTLFTNLFVHSGFWHLFFNMLMLYLVGTMFVRQFGERRLWATYLIGGLVGNAVYVLGYNLFPVFAPYVEEAVCVGASGAIMAVMFTVLVSRPNERMYLLPLIPSRGIAFKWVALIFVLIDVMSIADGANAGGSMAHLGGALYGSLYALFLRNDLKINFNRPKKRKQKKYYASSQCPKSDYDFNAQKHADEQKLNDILGKLSKNGYEGLTADERDFLFHYKK